MKAFFFDLVVTIFKFGEKPLTMSKSCLDIYLSIHHQLAIQMATPYLEKGWSISRIEVTNLQFISTDTYHYPD